MMSNTNTQGVFEHTKQVLHSIIKQIRDIIKPDTHPSIADKMIDSVHEMREYSKNGAHDADKALSILATAIEIARESGNSDLLVTTQLAAIEVATLNFSTPHQTPQLHAV
jgi:Cdc6-like AAA superfamily ATPase